MAIIEPNDEEKQEMLPNDFSTPFSPPSGIQDTTDDTHPDADTDLDEQERYDAGISSASGVDDSGNQGILGYAPPASDDEDN
jgi:hypothetical protein